MLVECAQLGKRAFNKLETKLGKPLPMNPDAMARMCKGGPCSQWMCSIMTWRS